MKIKAEVDLDNLYGCQYDSVDEIIVDEMIAEFKKLARAAIRKDPKFIELINNIKQKTITKIMKDLDV